jgi:hypothetical protein
MKTKVGTFTKYNRPDGSRLVRFDPPTKEGIWQDPAVDLGKFFGADADDQATNAVERSIADLSHSGTLSN